MRERHTIGVDDAMQNDRIVCVRFLVAVLENLPRSSVPCQILVLSGPKGCFHADHV